MTEDTKNAPVGLLLSKPQVEIGKIALSRLKDDYAAQNADPKAQAATAELLEAFERYGEGKTGLSEERQQAFQQAIMEAAAMGEKAAMKALRDLWSALARAEPDPAAKLAGLLVQNMQAAGHSTAIGILHACCRKLEAVGNRASEGAEAEKTAFQKLEAEFGTFLMDALESAKKGQPLWTNDPDLAENQGPTQ